MLTDDVKQILSEESISAIQDAFQSKTDLLIEAALVEQDSLYAEKLEQLMTAIDVDHTKKLRKVVEAVDRSNAKKLSNVVNKYEAEINSKEKNLKLLLLNQFLVT